MKNVLETLETQYGPLVASDDPVEAGFLTLLAEHAPNLSTPETRDRLRDRFVSWNELRVADPWDLVSAMGGGGNPAARAFARATLRFMGSLHGVLNRCAFDRVIRDPEVDLDATVGKMRGAPPATRAVMLAVLDGGWRPSRDMSRIAQKLGLIGRTSSLNRAAMALEELADPEDRVRTHYLLCRYAARAKEDPDPLTPAKKTAKKPAKKTARKPAKKTAKRKK